jgi:hypothetical protein
MGTRARVALALVLALAVCGCHRAGPPATSQPPPPKPALGTVEIRDVTPPSEEAPKGGWPDVAALEPALRARLLATGLFAAPDAGAPAGPTAAARLQVGLESVEIPRKGEARAQVSLRVESRPSDAPGAVALQLEGAGAKPYQTGAHAAKVDRQEIFRTLVMRLAGDLLDGYVARRRLQEGPPAAVHAALTADGGELRQEAIRAVGERQLRDEAPVLLKLLNDPDEPTRDAALGALIALGDRRAVTELTRSRSLRDRREMRKIIEAIAMLGGDEADDYLSFVAATHDDDEIRAAAAAARSRLQRRKSDAKAP